METTYTAYLAATSTVSVAETEKSVDQTTPPAQDHALTLLTLLTLPSARNAKLSDL